MPCRSTAAGAAHRQHRQRLRLRHSSRGWRNCTNGTPTKVWPCWAFRATSSAARTGLERGNRPLLPAQLRRELSDDGQIDVNGPEAAPLYCWLTAEAPGCSAARPSKWNFTKFLVGRDGQVIRRYAPQDAPQSSPATSRPRWPADRRPRRTRNRACIPRPRLARPTPGVAYHLRRRRPHGAGAHAPACRPPWRTGSPYMSAKAASGWPLASKARSSVRRAPRGRRFRPAPRRAKALALSSRPRTRSAYFRASSPTPRTPSRCAGAVWRQVFPGAAGGGTPPAAHGAHAPGRQRLTGTPADHGGCRQPPSGSVWSAHAGTSALLELVALQCLGMGGEQILEDAARAAAARRRTGADTRLASCSSSGCVRGPLTAATADAGQQRRARWPAANGGAGRHGGCCQGGSCARGRGSRSGAAGAESVVMANRGEPAARLAARQGGNPPSSQISGALAPCQFRARSGLKTLLLIMLQPDSRPRPWNVHAHLQPEAAASPAAARLLACVGLLAAAAHPHYTPPLHGWGTKHLDRLRTPVPQHAAWAATTGCRCALVKLELSHANHGRCAWASWISRA